MSDLTVLDASYCPRCGRPVTAASAVAISDGEVPEAFVGAFESEYAHVVVEGAEIRLYRHDDGGEP